jgi:hypothetical protein
MLLVEIEPHAYDRRRIDLELPVPLDVRELLGRRVVEGEYHR